MATNASPLPSTAVTVHCTTHNRAHNLPRPRIFSPPDHDTCRPRYLGVTRTPTTRYRTTPPTAGRQESPRPLPPPPSRSVPAPLRHCSGAARADGGGGGGPLVGWGGEGRRHQRLVFWSPGGGCVCVQPGLCGSPGWRGTRAGDDRGLIMAARRRLPNSWGYIGSFDGKI